MHMQTFKTTWGLSQEQPG